MLLMENLNPVARKPVAAAAALKWIVIILLCVGILFRFSNLGQKVYWHDEVFTSMEATAHTASELTSKMFDGQQSAPSALLSYQQIDPARTIPQLIFGIGSEDPQHPPLFYVLMHFWMRCWGSSVVATRSFAAILSLLVFPMVYWLCRELFASPSVAWIAIALLAISPIHLVYAQEAREYSLLTALTLLSSAALLRAMRLNQWQNWVLYGATLILAFYTSVFSALVAFGHGIFVVCIQPMSIRQILDGFQIQWQVSRRAVYFCITGAIAVIAFTPWFYFLKTYSATLKASAGWVGISLPISIGFKMWILNLTRVFLDTDQNPFAANTNSNELLVFLIILLEIYAFYFLIKNGTSSSKIFILALLAGTSLPLILPDILLGGQRSTVTRYFLPFFLCLQIAVAYLLSQLLFIAQKRSGRLIGIILSAILVCSSLISCGMYSQSNTWWNKIMSYHHPKISQILNASNHPILITDAYGYNPANILSLSYLLNDTVKLMLVSEVGVSKKIPSITDLAQPIYLLNLPDFFRNGFETRYGGKFQLVVGELWLWKRS
jgi:uncharacterized membrane protein